MLAGVAPAWATHGSSRERRCLNGDPGRLNVLVAAVDGGFQPGGGWLRWSAEGHASVWVVVKLTLANSARDQLGEEIRALRLQADGRRSLAVNLSETISLTRKLFELRDAAQRVR